MKSPLFIFGAGGHAKSVLGALEAAGFEVAAVIDDSPNAATLLGIPVHAAAHFDWPERFRYIVAIGNGTARKEKFKILRNRGGAPFTVIHPSACVSKHSSVGCGSVILGLAIIEPNATIHENVIVNIGSLIGHDCIVESHAHVSGNVSLGGNSHIGELAWVGLGAVVKEGTRIGKGAFIGMGALVSHDVPAWHKAISPHRKEATILAID